MDKFLIWGWRNGKAIRNWLLWAVVTGVVLGWGFAVLFSSQDDGKEVFLAGGGTSGHYQIEDQCSLCHDAFNSVDSKACLDCHKEELKLADDSHRAGIFKNPRNAPDLEKLDVTDCMVCHVEHDLKQVKRIGSTIADDFCIFCHEDVGEERNTHKDLPFDGCFDCHNYHDNRPLHEDVIAKHFDEPKTLPEATVPLRDFGERYRDKARHPTKPLKVAQANAPAEHAADQELMQHWASTAHAKSGVNCNSCHLDKSAEWVSDPALEMCSKCHKKENKGFLAGKHGMRSAQEGLSAMTPGMARLPMKDGIGNRELNCSSCHKSHAYNTTYAAVDACLSCHNDQHSVAYLESPHFKLYQAEVKGEAKPGSGVSCATCHMPRIEHRKGVEVRHNQNDNLRPNQKMLQDVCLQCHGYQYSINALFDKKLIEGNFAGDPSVHLKSVEMVKQRKN